MSTRGILCVTKNGEYKVAMYNHWDSYPHGLGAVIVDTLRKKENLDAFRENIDKATLLNKQDVFEKAYELAGGMDKYMMSPTIQKNKYFDQARDGYEFYEESSDIISQIIAGEEKCSISSLVFAADSLFCEWGYVINLDDNLFEVYKGFNKDALDEKERFASLTVKDDNSGYKQIKFVKAYPLDNLPEGHQMGDEIEELVSDEEEEKSENATDSMDIYLDGNHVETRYVDKTDIQSFVNDMVTLSFDNKGKKVLVYRNEVEFLKLFIKPDDN